MNSSYFLVHKTTTKILFGGQITPLYQIYNCYVNCLFSSRRRFPSTDELRNTLWQYDSMDSLFVNIENGNTEETNDDISDVVLTEYSRYIFRIRKDIAQFLQPYAYVQLFKEKERAKHETSHIRNILLSRDILQ